ncbi:epoxyqueuosine reductase QueH [Candidatus Falkowbacteria bacterium]|nr:epoxyqueuosine reductase QueH [Candidatus Falkowbacteria bacterium]
MKILLHDCCAPCGAFVVQELIKNGHEVMVYFYNLNIFPEDEYKSRLSEMERYCKKNNIPLIVGQYVHNEWLESVRGLENESEGGQRCEKCFLQRLNETAQKAMEEKFDGFATTLTISPHKPAEVINKIGRELAEFYGLKFIDTVWRKADGFKKSCALSAKENFHRQNYCGCEFSVRK